MSSQSFPFFARQSCSIGGSYYIGLQKIYDSVKSSPDPIAHTILLRIDCTEEDILSICRECIALHLGNSDVQYIPATLSIGNSSNNFNAAKDQLPSSKIHRANSCEGMEENVKSKVNTTPIIKVISNNPKNLWSTIVMYLGVDQRMERVLGITIYPIAVNDSNIFKGIVGISKSSNAHSGPSISDFSSAFIQNLCQECHLRQLTATTAPQNSDNLSLSESSEYKLDRNGIMEPSYIRDLQLAFAQRMVLRLLHEFSVIDNRIKWAEMRCARIMTLLRPAYQLAGAGVVQVPQLPAAPPSLNSYPLQLPPKRSKSIQEPDLEDCKLLFLRARRLFRDSKVDHSKDDGLLASNSPGQIDDEELREILDSLLSTQQALTDEACFVLRHLFSHFSVWAAQEFAARMARKSLATSDRSAALNVFKRELVFRLHRRFSDSGVTKLGDSRVDSRDRALLLRVKELFPFIDPIQEPVLLECTTAVFRNSVAKTSASAASGSLFITARNLLFCGGASTQAASSTGLLNLVLPSNLGSPELRVVPLRTLAGMFCDGRLCSYCEVNTPSNPAAVSAALKQLSAPPLCIAFIDVEGNSDTVLELRQLTVSDFVSRVADLIDVIVQAGLHVPSSGVVARAGLSSSGQGQSGGIQPANENLVLLHDTAQLSISWSEQAMIPQLIEGHTPDPTEQCLPRPEQQESISYSGRLQPFSSPDRVGLSDFEGESAVSSSGKPKKSLAANIQKFLQKSQQNSTKTAGNQEKVLEAAPSENMNLS